MVVSALKWKGLGQKDENRRELLAGEMRWTSSGRAMAVVALSKNAVRNDQGKSYILHLKDASIAGKEAVI